MSEHMHIYTDTQWTLIGFVIFFLMFLAFIASTYLPTQKKIHHHLSELPLDDSRKEKQ